jgi:hypothetical protein
MINFKSVDQTIETKPSVEWDLSVESIDFPASYSHKLVSHLLGRIWVSGCFAGLAIFSTTKSDIWFAGFLSFTFMCISIFLAITAGLMFFDEEYYD